MTQAEFDVYLDHVRAYVAAQPAILDAVDVSALTATERRGLERLRDRNRELATSQSAEAIAAELRATEHAGRRPDFLIAGFRGARSNASMVSAPSPPPRRR